MHNYSNYALIMRISFAVNKQDNMVWNGVLEELNKQFIRDMQDNNMCQHHEGNILECTLCEQKISTEELMNNILNSKRQELNNDIFCYDLPFSQERLDIYDMCSTVDFNKLNNEESEYVQSINKFNFQQHAWEHHWSCFKKGNECRFELPQPSTNSCIIFGEEKIKWFDINQHTPNRLKYIRAFDIIHKREIGDEYLNVHLKAFSQLLAQNNNIQFGDMVCLYNSTLYTSKTNQKDDNKEFKYVCDAITCRLKRISENISNDDDNNTL